MHFGRHSLNRNKLKVPVEPEVSHWADSAVLQTFPVGEGEELGKECILATERTISEVDEPCDRLSILELYLQL